MNLHPLISDYLDKLRSIARQPDASLELSYRPALNFLLEHLPETIGQTGLSLTPLTEPKRKYYGTPDYKIKTDRDWLVGYVEAKGLGVDLHEYEASEQIKRYCDSGQRILLTNHLEFALFDTNPSADYAVQRVDSVQLISKENLLVGRAPAMQNIEDLSRLFNRFLREVRPDINTPRELAERLAGVARHTRYLLRQAYDIETKEGDLHDLKSAFEKALIPDLSAEQFTDMYAQTIAYGLFAARCNHTQPEVFNLDNAWRDIPKTNPFLRKLFESLTGSALEDKPYRWIIEDLAHLLAAVNLEAILHDFGKHTRQEDPVVHFYETFLAAYDPKLREVRGVYYTPEPVVSYIVRSVDYLLKTRFQCFNGLADTATVEVECKGKDGKVKQDVHPRVLILDPACGTGTFLYAIIDHIRRQFMQNNNAGMWSDYVRRHLLPRLFGFELLMAPYAVAHLKLGMQLAGQDLSPAQQAKWAYDFGGAERLGIYLTNTLEEAERITQAELYWTRFIADEANAAASVKRDLPIMVVLGNPPYENFSSNKGEWILKLLEDYKKELHEKKLNLDDDFIKFIRFGQWRIENTGAGILALITNNTYLDGITHRRMRQSLMETFTDIYILDLHGSIRKKEKTPDGLNDENVFGQIQQGVTISIFIKEPGKKELAKVRYADLWGLQESKYNWLNEKDIATTNWKEISDIQRQSCLGSFYFFTPKSFENIDEYCNGWSIINIFSINQNALKTDRDELFFAFEKDVLEKRIKTFYSEEALLPSFRDRYNVENSSSYDLLSRRLSTSYNPANIYQCLYRPLNNRYLYYNHKLTSRPAWDVMYHMLAGNNLGLITTRQTCEEWGLFATRNICGHKSCAAYDINSLFPLYLYPDPVKPTLTEHWPAGQNGRRPNLNPAFVADMEKRLGLRFIPDSRGDLIQTFGPEDIFHYIYAISHAPTYRSRYAEFLKIDFPRVPLTSDQDLFRTLCAKGADLAALHLLEDDYSAASWNQSPSHPPHPNPLPSGEREYTKEGERVINPLQQTFTSFPVRGENIVERVEYKSPGEKIAGEETSLTHGRVYISKPSPGAKTAQYFDNVPPEVWEFHIGGYQVAQKWLKDRKGRPLSYDDVRHYQRMITAVSETIRLMGEIDKAISTWPMYSPG